MRKNNLINSSAILAVLLLTPAFQLPAEAQSIAYQPFGSWVDPRIELASNWESSLRLADSRAMRTDARPQAAGFRPVEVELLEDALLRKHPKLLDGSPQKARELLLRRFRNNLPQLRGIMAEAVFLDRNPAWGYVEKANAPQHDVYRWRPGSRTPWNGQVKFHVDGKASTYARDMKKDNMAHRFFVPDDHVAELKEHLSQKAKTLEAAGKPIEAKQVWRDYGRVRGIGATSAEIHDATLRAARSVAREKYSSYTSLGTALAVTSGYLIWDWSQGNLYGNEVPYHLCRGGSVLAAGLGTDLLLMQIRNGALRGTLRGNVIVGTVISVTEVAWLLNDYGWRQAFHKPEFYESVAGGIGGVTLGLAAGTITTAVTAETGPLAPVLGTAAGLAAGTLGYLGGRKAAHFFLEILDPEFLHAQERQRFQFVKDEINRRLAEASLCPQVQGTTSITGS